MPARLLNGKMDNKIGTFEFLTEPFHVDYTGHLTLSVMGNHILNCAGMHADARGFGISMLNKENCTWVLSRIVFEMDKMPYEYDKFHINTWVESVYKLFSGRNFEIVSESGETLGYARSIWAMINLETRKPVNLLEINDGRICDYIIEGKECPIEGPSRIKVNATEPVASYKAKYSDIDINNHFNSVRHIEHILDLFPLEKFKDCSLKRFEIAYINESYYGDTLDFYLDDNSNNSYTVEIKNQASGDVVCRSLIAFR